MSKAKGKALAKKPKSKKNEKDSCKNLSEHHKVTDAKNFMDILRIRTNRDKKSEKIKDAKLDLKDGGKIAEYLDSVVPDWEFMDDTRLYKHIQKMFENSEGIRRFEIDLVWKRGVYIISLIVAFSTAFGGLFYFIYKVDNLKEKAILWLVLILITFANAVLSFCLAIINTESHKWQKNWECHVDYLQAILGLNLMRICLRRGKGFFTISRVNIFIGHFMCVIWLLVTIFLLLFGYSNFAKPSLEWYTFAFRTSVALTSVFSAIYILYACLEIMKCGKNMHPRELEKFDFPPKEDENKGTCY